MTINERIKEIEKLQKLEVPWQVSRLGLHVSLFGDQIAFTNEGGDYVDVMEARQALDWLIEQLGGKVKWSK